MRIVATTYLSVEQKQTVYNIWNEVYPLRLKYSELKEFDTYLDKLSDQHHYLLVNDLGQVAGWAFRFQREDETWFAILLDEAVQGKGYGSLLLGEFKKDVSKLCGWVADRSTDLKQNGDIYRSPMAFYLKNGFNVIEDQRLENEKISAVKIEWCSLTVSKKGICQ